MARSGAIGGRHGAGGMSPMKPVIVGMYYGKPRPIRPPQGRNGEVRIIKERTMGEYIDYEEIAKLEKEQIKEREEQEKEE